MSGPPALTKAALDAAIRSMLVYDGPSEAIPKSAYYLRIDPFWVEYARADRRKARRMRRKLKKET